MSSWRLLLSDEASSLGGSSLGRILASSHLKDLQVVIDDSTVGTIEILGNRLMIARMWSLVCLALGRETSGPAGGEISVHSCRPFSFIVP